MSEHRADLEALGASATAILDFERVTEGLTFAINPEIPVDPGDGNIVLHWQRPGENRAFGLCFPGNGDVVGVFSPSRAEQPIWRKRVDDVKEVRLATDLAILAALR